VAARTEEIRAGGWAEFARQVSGAHAAGRLVEIDADAEGFSASSTCAGPCDGSCARPCAGEGP
jgi:hypothetical protein